jgi:hypothetical protein
MSGFQPSTFHTTSPTVVAASTEVNWCLGLDELRRTPVQRYVGVTGIAGTHCLTTASAAPHADAGCTPSSPRAVVSLRLPKQNPPRSYPNPEALTHALASALTSASASAHPVGHAGELRTNVSSRALTLSSPARVLGTPS